MRLLLTAFFAIALAVPESSAAEHSDPNAGLVPVTEFDGPALEFEFPGMAIGVAEYAEGPTGTTVFYFPGGVNAAVDVRGGSPGTILTDTLRLGYEDPWIKAIALSGGSAYGLAAATGAALEIRLESDDPGHWSEVPGVPGAIVFDVGDKRYNAVVPDERLGRAAIRAARPGYFPLGARGGGRFVMQGYYFGTPWYSGQGGAFGQYGDTRIAVFTVVNSMGTIVDRSGRVALCNAPDGEPCPFVSDRLAETRHASEPTGGQSDGLTGATTLTLVVTNRRLDFAGLQRLATQVHTSMGRAIQPFHTLYDGDTLFAVTTGEVEDERMSLDQLGVLASELAWDAVLASVPPQPRRPDPVTPEPNERDGWKRLTGIYAFAPGMRATVTLKDGELFVSAPARNSYYLPGGSETRLLPAADELFVLDTPRRDTVTFEPETDAGPARLVINPGSWPVAAGQVE